MVSDGRSWTAWAFGGGSVGGLSAVECGGVENRVELNLVRDHFKKSRVPREGGVVVGGNSSKSENRTMLDLPVHPREGARS
jgi:hypothetical protein